MTAAITKTNMRKLAKIMAKRRPAGVFSGGRFQNDWIDLVRDMSQEVVAGADSEEFLRLCDEGHMARGRG